MKRAVIYVHGKGGNADEAKRYRPFFDGSDVVGFDYKSQTPWEAKDEFTQYFERAKRTYDSVTLIADSIGAFFCMSALSKKHVDNALFISPIVDMEQLIYDMMGWANVTEEELFSRKIIPTAFGEALSWKYLGYVREHPIKWSVPTCILYGKKDDLTSLRTVSEFARRTGAKLTVMNDGEHWFHTEEQIKFLERWIVSSVK
ncbi:MAG: alpha/beta hydrolase [Christensenellaceae bacterium]